MLLIKTSRWLLALLLLITPFIYPSSIFEFTATIKELVVYSGVILIILATFLFYLYSGKLVLVRSPLNFFILTLVLYAGAVFLFSPNKNLSLFGEPNSFASFYHFILYGLVYFLCLQFFKIDLQHLHLTIFTIMAILMGIIDIILILYFLEVFVVPGFLIGSYNNFLFLAGLIFVIFVFLYIYYYYFRFWFINFLGALLGLVSFFLILIASFNNIILWVGLGLTFILASSLIASFSDEANKNQIKKKHQLKVIFFPVLVIVSLLVIIVPPSLKTIISTQLNKFIKTPPTEITLTHRYSVNLAFSSIKTNTFFGQGFGHLPFYYEVKKDPSVYLTDFGNITFSQTANLPSQLLIEAGLTFTLIFYGTLFFALFYLFRKLVRKDEPMIGFRDDMFLAIIILGYMVVSSILSNYSFSQGLLFFGILGIIATNVARTGIVEIRFNSRKNKFIANLTAFTLMTAFIFMYISVARNFSSLLWYFKKVLPVSNLETRLDYLNKAYLLSSSNDLITREISLIYLNLALEKIKQSSEKTTSKELNVETTQIIGYLQNSINLAKQSIQLNPLNYLNYQLAGFIYESMIGYAQGSFEEALKYYNSALDFSTNNPLIHYFIARSYYRQILSQVQKFAANQSTNVNNEPLQVFLSSYIARGELSLRKALEIKPLFTEAHILLGDFRVLANKIDEAIQSYASSAFLNPNPQIYYQLGALYYWQKKDLARAKVNLLKSIELLPNYSDARYLLALIYNEENNFQEALKHLEVIELHNPNNPIISEMIKNIKLKLRK